MTRDTKEILRIQLLREINRKIRILEFRIFTNTQALPQTDNLNTLSSVSTNKQRKEINQIIHWCNQNIIKLSLMKRFLTIHNVICVFKCLANDKYQHISLSELNELLGKGSQTNCEKEQPKVLTKYSTTA